MASVSKVSSNGNHKFTLTVVRNSSDVDANTSNITATFKISPQTTNAYGWNYTSGSPVTYTITIDGKSYTGTVLKYTKNTTATIRTITINVPHNTDGTKTIAYGFSVKSLSGNILPGTASANGNMTLAKINRASTFSFGGTWYIGHNEKIVISAYDDSFYHRLSYSMGNTSGYWDIGGKGNTDPQQVNGTLYVDVPAELGNEIPAALSGTLKVTLETLLKDAETGEFTSIGSVSKNATVHIDKELCKPVLEPTVVDINPETTYLTGNDQLLVKYHSKARVSAGAYALGGATMQTVGITNGDDYRRFNDTDVHVAEFDNIENNEFKIQVRDSRGLTAETTYRRPMVEYVHPTVNMELTRPNGEGVMDLHLYGNYFNEGFGDYDNVIILMFRCKSPDDEDWRDWVYVPVEDINFSEWKDGVNEFTYDVDVQYTVPDYTQKWTFEARIADMLETVDSAQHSVKAFPTFDWSEDDFNFNVPVKFSYEGGMTSIALVGMANALSSVYNFTVTSTNNTGWTVTAKNSSLIGGSLRFSFNATRDTALAAGNNTNEDIGSFTIKHGGKLAQAGNTSFVSGATGPVCSFVTTNLSLGDEELTFTVQLAANSASAKQVGGFVILPVALNLEAFATTLGEEDIPDEASLMTLALDDFGYEPSEDITIV